MTKDLKITVRLDYGRYLVLDPTPANLKLAKHLAEAPLYCTEYDADYRNMSYHPRTNESNPVLVEMHQIEVSDIDIDTYRKAVSEQRDRAQKLKELADADHLEAAE